MIVVGLTGLAGAGKSEVANHLVANHGFTKLSFAGPLKTTLRTLNPIVGRDERGLYRVNDLFAFMKDEAAVKASVYGPEYRRLLQVLGTDCIRSVDDGFWVRAALAQLTDPDGRYVFDDVRFPNEATAVKVSAPFNHAHLWYIVRPGHDGGAGSHASEQHAGNMGEDRAVFNDGTIERLLSTIDLYLESSMISQPPMEAKDHGPVLHDLLQPADPGGRPVRPVDPVPDMGQLEGRDESGGRAAPVGGHAVIAEWLGELDGES